MTSLMLEHLGVPSSAKGMRMRERARREAIDELAGRTVWCAAGAPERRSAAEALRSRLRGAGAVATGRLDIAVDGPLSDLARQLDAILSGSARGQRQLDGEQQEIYAGALRDGETLIGGAVRHDDVVVISDPLVAVRRRGRSRARGTGRVAARAVPPVWRGRRRVELHRAFVAADRRLRDELEHASARRAGAVRRRRVPSRPRRGRREGAEHRRRRPAVGRELGWSRLLGDIARAGREEHVGGVVHARPAIAMR